MNFSQRAQAQKYVTLASEFLMSVLSNFKLLAIFKFSKLKTSHNYPISTFMFVTVPFFTRTFMNIFRKFLPIFFPYLKVVYLFKHQYKYIYIYIYIY